MKLQKSLINDRDIDLIISVLEKTEEKRKKIDIALLENSRFLGFLSKEEKQLIDKISDIDPRLFGLNLTYFGKQAIPDNLVFLQNQNVVKHGDGPTIEKQYLTKKVFDSYTKMNTALHNATGKKLFVASGYRSQTSQLLILLHSIYSNNFDLSVALRSVALPNYSEHCLVDEHAVDFLSSDFNSFDNNAIKFMQTIEYNWLCEHAGEFNFYESYPENNSYGIIAEPWHWRFCSAN